MIGLEMHELWNQDQDHDHLMSNDRYYDLLIEQYRIYVELADRAGFRRVIINLFFLITNIFLIGILSLALEHSLHRSLLLIFVPFIGLLAICYCWWRVVRFYRHTVNIKEQVIGALEKRLPSSPIFSAEYLTAEKHGSFEAIKRLETNIPFIFMGLYTIIYILLIIWHY